MYLLEPIDDAALLQQVTSRAHRLGATGPVTVETVNVWQELDDATKIATKDVVLARDSGVGGNGPGSALLSVLQDEHQTGKAVCQFCCRSFPSMARAVEHERTNCTQNPNSCAEEDEFELATLYRAVRPPLALLASNQEAS